MTREEQHQYLARLLEQVAQINVEDDEIQPGDSPQLASRILEVVNILRVISHHVRFVEISMDGEFEDYDYDTKPFDEIARQHGGAASESSVVGEGYIFTDLEKAQACADALAEKADELKMGVLVELMTLDELLLADIELN